MILAHYITITSDFMLVGLQVIPVTKVFASKMDFPLRSFLSENKCYHILCDVIVHIA